MGPQGAAQKRARTEHDELSPAPLAEYEEVAEEEVEEEEEAETPSCIYHNDGGVCCGLRVKQHDSDFGSLAHQFQQIAPYLFFHLFYAHDLHVSCLSPSGAGSDPKQVGGAAGMSC